MCASCADALLPFLLLSINLLALLMLISGGGLFFINIRKDDALSNVYVRTGWKLIVISGLIACAVALTGAALSALDVL